MEETQISETSQLSTKETDAVLRAVRLLIVVSFFLLVIGIGNLYMTLYRADQIDKVDESVAQINESVTRIRRVSDRVEKQQEQSPEAVAVAIHLIPEIHNILCHEFPNPTNC